MSTYTSEELRHRRDVLITHTLSQVRAQLAEARREVDRLDAEARRLSAMLGEPPAEAEATVTCPLCEKDHHYFTPASETGRHYFTCPATGRRFTGIVRPK